MDDRTPARLDVALVQRNLVPSRERAQEAIAAGMVLVGGSVAKKASQRVGPDETIAVTGDPIGYVGRGGLKLEAALDRWQLDPAGTVCLDVGASTGGFTDCLLRRGARLVYAVDVGRGQLHPTLLADSRVVSMEETDVRTLHSLPEAPVLAVVDVSFISATLVLPHVVRLAAPGACIICLVKPQFEVGPGAVGKGGIVRDRGARQRAVDRVVSAAAAIGLKFGGSMASPVLGTEGNQEYLALFGLEQNGRSTSS